MYSNLRTAARGSSPHTRGAPIADGSFSNDNGIIPAYAGSTDPNRSFGEKMADHPRIRGEHSSPLLDDVYSIGSSPHTRGAREFGLGVPGSGGIIPAYAGSTVKLSYT